MSCSGNLVNREKDVSDVQRDVSAYFRVKYQVAHSSFPDAVEVQTDEFSLAIQYRASGVTSCCVVCRKEAYRYKSSLISPLTEIPRGIEVNGLMRLDLYRYASLRQTTQQEVTPEALY